MSLPEFNDGSHATPGIMPTDFTCADLHNQPYPARMNRDIVLLLLAVLVLSFAPLFARFISHGAVEITWWRCLFASLALFFLLLPRQRYRVAPAQLRWLLATGVLLGLHWWTFFLSIQLSSVSIGVVMLFTYPLFSALAEPLFTPARFSTRQVVGGLGIIAGVYLLVPEFSLDNSVTAGVLTGLVSALLYAMRNILTRSRLRRQPAMTTLFYQMLFSLPVVGLIVLLTVPAIHLPRGEDLVYLVILALGITVLGHGLMTHCFKLFSASTVGIVASMQVVFSSVLAFLFLAEIPRGSFYPGAAIIISIAIYELLPARQAGR